MKRIIVDYSKLTNEILNLLVENDFLTDMMILILSVSGMPTMN
jgi:hypothetical protein